MNAVAAPPLSVYVHLPWCVHKCPYCDFNSHAVDGTFPEADYVEAVEAGIESFRAAAGGRRALSVFFGGGTPSLFSADAIGRIIDRIDRAIGLETDAEITLEANPGTVEHGDFSALRSVGVNRLSIGVQSFDDAALQRIGRIHGAQEARAAVAQALAAGFERVNIDLMYGLPGQAPEAAVADIAQALDCGVGHISWYQLTLEPNTRFAAFPPVLPDEDSIEAMQAAGSARLLEAGFRQYEVSAWARDGQRCRHNLNYWTFGDYVGVGAGAHGKLTDPATGRIRRSVQARHPKAWLADPGTRFVEPPGADIDFEFMLNAMRLVDGFEVSLYEQRTGRAHAGLHERLAALAARGLVDADAKRIRPTVLGRRFLNDVVGSFLAAQHPAAARGATGES